MTYSTISFYNEDLNECLEICFHNHCLYGNLDGEDLSNAELIDCINSLNECDTIRLIKACNGPKRFKHAYRKLFWESPVKRLDRELKDQNSSLEEYLQLSYRAGLNPLPALRSRNIVVRFGGQNTISPHFTNEDIIVCLYEGYVSIVYNPWNADTATRIVNKGLQFKLDQASDVKRNREYRQKHRIVRKKIVRYSEED